MRLNRGTLLLILASLVVIVGALVLSNQPAAAPENGTPTATPSAGPVFEGLDTTNVVRLEIIKTEDSGKVVMTKDAANVWTIAEATNPQTLATDQTKATDVVSKLAEVTALDKFESETLADFGLDKPTYTMTMTDADGKTYIIKVGNKSAVNPRYFALVNDDAKTVYVLPADVIDGLTVQIVNPAYVASPTPTLTLTATPNPYSEVEQTQTAEAELQQLYADLTATAQVPESTAEATAETTAEATMEAEAAASSTPVPATVAASNTPVPPTAKPTNTRQSPTATTAPSNTPLPPTATKPGPTITPSPTATPT